jgi:LuxR family maltose regulon positive regulatory protein
MTWLEITDPFILIIDDFQRLQNPVITHSLSFFIENIPPQFHLLIASRTEPPLPLALMRGRGQLLEIRLAELRFSSEETSRFSWMRGSQ